MSRKWETRTDGRMCLVIDSEDGTQPQRVYGKDKDEILEKVANTVEHSARHIAALQAQAVTATASPATPTKPPAPAPRKSLTADELMTRTADLSNPSKAPGAIRDLLNEATDGALTEFEQFRQGRKLTAVTNRVAATAASWARKHPEFPVHPTNQKMLLDSATLRVGLENITEDVLQSVFLGLLESGHLVQADSSEPENEPSPAVQPGETPAPRTARPPSATTYRKANLRAGAPAAQPQQARYTRQQIEDMPADDLLNKMQNEQGFADLVALYRTTPRKATA